MSKEEFWHQTDEQKLRSALKDLRVFKQLEERGYGDLLLARYPSMRKYFADFVRLPFETDHDRDPLMRALHLVRQLDSAQLKELPREAPIAFVPKELRLALKDNSSNINRNAWEMGLALAMKDALRSGDLYLPQSKQHVSFWDFMLSDLDWQEVKETSFIELQQPQRLEARTKLIQEFHDGVIEAKNQFSSDLSLECLVLEQGKAN